MFSLPGLLSLVSRVPAVVWLVLTLGGWGLWGHHNANALKAAIAAERAESSENARELERLANRANSRVGDNLVKDTNKRAARTRAAAERLRDAAASNTAGDVSGTACRSDAAPVFGFRDETREALVKLADDADATADALRACQAYIREVVRPGDAPSSRF